MDLLINKNEMIIKKIKPNMHLVEITSSTKALD